MVMLLKLDLVLISWASSFLYNKGQRFLNPKSVQGIKTCVVEIARCFLNGGYGLRTSGVYCSCPQLSFMLLKKVIAVKVQQEF